MLSEPARALLGEGAWVVIAGLFDPLTALQAKRLSGFRRAGRKLMAIVEPGENPLLNAEARAALIAALTGRRCSYYWRLRPFNTPSSFIRGTDRRYSG